MKHIWEIPDYVLSCDFAGNGAANSVPMIGAMEVAIRMAKGKEYSFA